MDCYASDICIDIVIVMGNIWKFLPTRADVLQSTFFKIVVYFITIFELCDQMWPTDYVLTKVAQNMWRYDTTEP